MLELGTAQMKIWRMLTASWIPKARDTHSGHVILLAFPPRQWLQERTSMLRYTYIACLVSSIDRYTNMCGSPADGFMIIFY